MLEKKCGNKERWVFSLFLKTKKKKTKKGKGKERNDGNTKGKF